MLTFSQMLTRFAIALVLGAVIGVERESSGKEAGIRTAMLVCAGAAIFTIIGLELPYIISIPQGDLVQAADIISRNGGSLGIIANIVVGIGFLGAGIIIKTGEHVHGLTTAAVVWMTAAVGTLIGIGLTEFAVVISVTVTILLYVLRKLHLFERIRPEN